MIKENKIKAIASSALILLPALIALIFFDRLNVLVAQRLLGQSARGMLLMMILLPCFLLLLHWVMLLVTAHDHRKNPQHRKLTGIIFFIIPVLSLFVSGIFFAIMLGWQISIQLLCGVTLGVAMLILGNYLPKCTPNHTMGPRMRWTLTNEENWRATCRFMGKIMFFDGLIFLFTVFLPLPVFIPVMLVLIATPAILPTVFSYRFYKKQVAAGTRERLDYKTNRSSKVAALITAVTLPLILGFCAVLMLTGDITVSFESEALYIEADYHEDLTLPYTDIAEVRYVEEDRATRQYGFGSLRLDMGVYQNEALGTHTRYAYHKCHAAVVITATDGQILVLNGIDEDATKALYSSLREKVGS